MYSRKAKKHNILYTESEVAKCIAFSDFLLAEKPKFSRDKHLHTGLAYGIRDAIL